jgi:hypothetical protein
MYDSTFHFLAGVIKDGKSLYHWLNSHPTEYYDENLLQQYFVTQLT